MRKLSWNDAQTIISDKKNQNKLFFLEFTTTWCGDCKMMEPIIKNVSKRFADSKYVDFIEIDAEQAKLFRDPNSKYKVLIVPTYVLIKDNKILRMGHEYYPQELLIDWIDEFTE